MRTGPETRPANRTTGQTFDKSRQTRLPLTVHRRATANLLGRAALYNKLAKAATSGADRKRLYMFKARAVSRLLAVGAGRVEEILFDRGIATIALVDGRRQHIRLGHLSTEGSAVLASTLRDRLERAS